MSLPQISIPAPSPSSSSYNSSLLIIATLLAFVLAFTIVVHLILRLLARLSSVAPSPSPSPSPSHINATSSNSTSTTNTTAATNLDHNRKILIDSLPLFTISSLPQSPSSNCTICLSQFTLNDKLRLLPPCLHAFHSSCIDAWLNSSPSCPLCRSSVQIQCPEPPPVAAPQVLEEEAHSNVEETERVPWLKEYVDRLAVSASSSFNSMRFSSSSPFSSTRFSSWGSRRFDGDVSGSLELGESFRSEESGYLASSFKWILGGAAS